EKELRRRLTTRAVNVSRLPKEMPTAGVYLFSEGGKPLYVGRSGKGLRQRVQRHSRSSAKHNSASFAFRLACGKVGVKTPMQRAGASRADLERDPRFARAFAEGKLRIQRMDLPYAEERHPVRQALLEIYAAPALRTPYNDFDTH